MRDNPHDKKTGTHVKSDGVRKNPGEVENNEPFVMSAGRYYAREWTTYALEKIAGYPLESDWTPEFVAQIDVVSDMMQEGRRDEAAKLAHEISDQLKIPSSKVSTTRPPSTKSDIPDVIELAFGRFRQHSWVLVGSGHIIHMWTDHEIRGWGAIAIQQWITTNYPAMDHYAIQQWITTNYGGAYSFDGEDSNLTLLHYRGDLDAMLAFSRSKDFEPPMSKSKDVEIRQWTKEDERRKGDQLGRSVWWWNNRVNTVLDMGDIKTHVDNFAIGFVMGLAQYLDKNASLYRKAPGMKQNPGEPSDDMSWAMKAGRMQGELDWDGHLPLTPEMRAELEAASDALETKDPTQRLRAIQILLRVDRDPWSLSGEIDSPNAADPGFPAWLSAKTALIKHRMVDKNAKVVYSGDLAMIASARWPTSDNEIGAYMEDVGLTYRDALAGNYGYRIVEGSVLTRMQRGKPDEYAWHDYLIGYWMAVINFQWQQDMKTTKTKKNPAPLSDKEWWEGVLAKKRKKNPPDDISDEEIEMAVAEGGVVNREQRRRLLALVEKAQRTIAAMPPRDRRSYSQQQRADEIDRQISIIRSKLEQHSNLVADLEGRRLNPAGGEDQNVVADREAAVKMYKTFWRMEPKKLGEFHASFKIPSKVKEMGAGHSIMYRSLKTDPETLEKPKKPVDYIHHFDAGVFMYGPSSSGDVSVPSWITDVTSLTLLGSCLGWEIKVGNKIREAEGIAPLPELYTIPNGRALLVIQDKREVLAVFWGGDLGVEGRGIVH